MKRGSIFAILGTVLAFLPANAPAQKLKAATLLPTQGFVNYLTSADINGDGIQDVVYEESSATSQAIVVQFGKGDGTFQAAVVTVLPEYNSTLGCCGGQFTLADINGDGVADAIFGGTSFNHGIYKAAIVVLPGNRDGTFGNPVVSVMTLESSSTSYPAPSGNMAIGDWNGDGHADVAFADSTLGNVGIALGDGTGKFTQVHSYLFGIDLALHLTPATDLNGDGKPDFVVVGNSAGGLGIFLNAGGGAFTQTILLTPYNSVTCLIADVNGDGKQDLVYSGAVLPNYLDTVSVALGNGDGTFQAATPLIAYAGPNPEVEQLIDLDGDGIPDLLLNTLNGAAYLSGDGHGGFSGLKEVSVGPVDLDNYVVGMDVNGDGKNDLVASGIGAYNSNVQQSPGLILVINEGGGNFDTTDLYDAVSDWNDGLVGDFNNDGFTDVLTYTTGVPEVFFGNASGVLKGANIPETPASGYPTYAVVGDVNGDGKLDLVETPGAYMPTLWAAGNGDGTFAAGQVVPGTSDPDIDEGVVTVQDFNQDGIADILFLASNNGPTLALGSKTGPQNPVNVTLPNADVGTFIDLNGDGLLDDVFTTGTDVDVAIASSPTMFGASVVVLSATYPTVLVADVDGDGIPDLIVNFENADETFTNEVLYGKGDGTFGTPQPLTFPPHASVLAVADLNLDGSPDLLLSDYDYLYVLHGLGSRTFAATPDRYPSATVVDIVRVGDFNGDGSPDVYVVNSDNSFVVHLNRGGDQGTLTTNPNPLVYGEVPFTISAAVAETVPGSGIPSGTVTISVDSEALGTITLSNGAGEISDSSILAAGSHMISAHYPGDGSFNAKSFSVTQIVNKATTTVNLTATPVSIVAGESVALSAAVTPEYAGTPTGTVTFNSGSTQVASGALSSGGVASATASGLAAGNYSIVANYGGDGNFLAGASSAQAVAVTDFSISAAPTSLTANAGGTATTTVTVNPINGFNGTVKLSCAGTSAVTCSFSPATVNVNGAAAPSTLTLTAGANSAGLRVHGRSLLVLAILLPLGIVRKRKLRGVLLGCCLLGSFLTGCGGGSGGGGGGGKSMTYNITVQATYSSNSAITRKTNVTIVVTQ